MKSFTPACALALLTTCCNGTTGDELLTFPANVRGVAGATQPFRTIATVNNGIVEYSLQLSVAKMYIGGVYADESPLATGAESPICIQPGVYAAEVPGGTVFDVLSSAPQPFPVAGNGTADLALSRQLWLTNGDVTAETNIDPNTNHALHIVDLQGVATRLSDHTPFPFGATVTIGDNRLPPVSDPAQPGNNPICKQRILLIGGISAVFFQGGSMEITVDPRGWFHQNVDYSTLPYVTAQNCEDDADGPLLGDPNGCGGFCNAVSAGGAQQEYCIPDSNLLAGSVAGSTQGHNFFTGVLTAGPIQSETETPTGAYSLEYVGAQ